MRRLPTYPAPTSTKCKKAITAKWLGITVPIPLLGRADEWSSSMPFAAVPESLKRDEKPQPDSGGRGPGLPSSKRLRNKHSRRNQSRLQSKSYYDQAADRSPMTLSATPISTAAEQQHDHDDNQN